MDKAIQWTVLAGVVLCLALAVWAAFGLLAAWAEQVSPGVLIPSPAGELRSSSWRVPAPVAVLVVRRPDGVIEQVLVVGQVRHRSGLLAVEDLR
jgi:hypothetical protein